MVLLIKNKHASFEDVARFSDSPAGDSPRIRLAKLSMQSLRNAGVSKAKSMPHINLLAEGTSLKARRAAVLSVDLHKLKPRELIARKVKSAKEDLRQLFDNTSSKQRVKPAREPGDSISTELACSKTAFDVGTSTSLDSLSSVAISVPAPWDGKDEDDHLRCLTAVAQNWLDFERLFSRCRSHLDQTIEDARHDFCQALVQSFSDCLPAASAVSHPSGDVVDLPLIHPPSSSPVSSSAPSAITLANQTTMTLRPFESPAPEDPAQSPEFSDEELKREFDEFSFHSSQEEEWTSELESRKQNAMNRALSDMKRKLAIPIPKLSSYFSDDSLADSAAHRTLVNPPASCSGVPSKEADSSSSYSADQEDEADEDDESVAVSPLDPPIWTSTPDIDPTIMPTCLAELSLSSQIESHTPGVAVQAGESGGAVFSSEVDTAITPTCPAEVSLSSQIDDHTSDRKQADSDVRTADGEDATDDVCKVLATYVPRLLTRISEESLADEYEIEATAEHPPLSFRRPTSQYRRILWLRRHHTPLPDVMDHIDSTPAAPLEEGTGYSGVASSNTGISAAATTDSHNDSSLSSVASPEKTLRRVRKFMDLKNSVVLPTVQHMSSSETICETISLHEEASPPESKARRLRRVPGCLDLRKAFGGTDISTDTPPSLSGIEGHSLQNLGGRFSFKEQHCLSDLEERCNIQPVSSRCHALSSEDSAKPPVPPKSPGFRLPRKRNPPSSTTVQEPSCSSLCSRCDPSSSLPLWSCAKITRSRGKQGRPLNESTKALKKRLDSICINPETIHGHSPQRGRQKLPPISSATESRKSKTSKKTGKLEKNNSMKAIVMQNIEKQKISKKLERHICLMTCVLQGPKSLSRGVQ